MNESSPKHRLLIELCLKHQLAFFRWSAGLLLIEREGIESIVEDLSAQGIPIIGLDGFELDGVEVHSRLDLIFDSEWSESSPMAVLAAWPTEVWVDMTIGGIPSGEDPVQSQLESRGNSVAGSQPACAGAALPRGVDARLEFLSSTRAGRHFFTGNAHTFLGRMEAFHEDGYEVSVSRAEVSRLSDFAAVWMDGFLAGSEPSPPDSGGVEAETAWDRIRGEYRKTGELTAENSDEE